MGMKTIGSIQLWYVYAHKKIRSGSADLNMWLFAVHLGLVFFPSFIKRSHRVQIINIQLQI
ncbi:hypothetical protein DIC78_20745 [Bacillus halotolerans]|uniref:Uncharacterized protein n=1 Tax=Bacillus halotolerans TaxID=260554 RepID=A0A9Q6F2D7_9BACI|nr:hypothetical protein DIC78_20745 [Bacillus halotolerans]PLR90166.1 hypothetical protein CTZ29_11250 [Bacillus halotolerans]PLS07710.1 hypothetical protein CUU63_10525 [Bacillus halotolerans]PRS01340.1 hypothetical protein C6W26_17495 [Bacillus halotolerans]PRS22006.1 hypothetical protein C6W25_09585 [Bacillus halotolerans]